MPKQVADIRKFLQQARSKDAKTVKVKIAAHQVKFKLRFAKQLLTLVVNNKKKAKKIRKSFPKQLPVVMLSTRNKKSTAITAE